MRRLVWLAVLIVLGNGGAGATAFTSRATGNWNATGTWATLRTGTITTSTSSTTVTGSGTLFLTELANGNQLFTANGVLIGTVASRTNNTTLTLTANAASSNSNIVYYATAAATPVATDDVAINSGHNVSLNAANRSALSLVINTGGTLTTGSNNVTIAAGAGVLTIDGNVAGNGNAASRIIKNSTGTLSGTGTITNLNDMTIVGNTTIDAATNLTFTGAECRLDLSANAGVINDGTLTFNAAACGTSKVINLANPASFTNNGTVLAGSIVGANAAGSVWTNAAGSTLQVTGALLATGTLNASASNNTVHYNVNAAQAVKLPSGGQYYDLTLSGGNTKTPSAGTYNILHDLTINTGVTFNANTSDPTINVTRNVVVAGTYTASNNAGRPLSIGGNLTVSGTFTGNTSPVNLAGDFTRTGTYATGAGVFTFNGTSATPQTFTGATTITNVTINNSGAGVTLANNLTLGAAGTLVLTNGTINTGGSSVVTPRACNAPSVTRTNGWINGNLQKAIPNGASTCTFEIGDATSYTPATLVFAAGTGAGNLTANVTAGDHPSIGSSSIDLNFTVNRYWTLTNGGVTVTTYTATFTFINPGDLDADTNTANVQIQRFAGGTWSSTTIGTRTATTTQATGLTAFGDFQIGELRPGSGTASFNAVEVAANAVTGVITTKVAAVTFSLDLVALNSARTAINAAFKGPVTVEVLDASNNAGVLDANGCRNTWTTIQSFSAAFLSTDGGRKTTSFTESNIYRDVRVRVKYTVAGTDLLIGCSSDNFAIRPSTFSGVSATDLDWGTAYTGTGTARNLTNTGSSGGVVHKADQPFTMTATAVNGAGTPAVMTTYNGSPVAVVSAILQPAACGSCALGSLIFTSWSASSGTVTSTTASYSEAGSLTIHLEDQTYANVDASDGVSTTADRYVIGPDFNVGRFVPDHFTFAGPSVPVLQTFGSACASRSFTYVGQPFWYSTLPSATIEARNAANNVTTNYRGTLFKLTAADLGEAYSNNSTGPTLNVGSAVSPPQLSTGNGTATYTAAASAANVNLAYARSAATPIVPFTANISLTVTASDGSESGVTGNGTIQQSSSLVFNGGGSGIAFDAGSEVRYGRLRLFNASGPATVDLPLTLRAEYYAGVATGFALNTADNCTPLSAANFKLSDHNGSLTAVNMSDAHVSVPAALAGGVASGMRLLKASPAVSAPGSVKICLDLDSAAGVGDTSCQAATPAGLSFLQGPWGAATYDKDPSARVTVGTFGAQPNNFIFQRENY